MQVQNVRDFPQTEVDSEIKAPFLLKQHCDPRFTKNRLIKNIFEEEKQFNIIVEHDFFFWKIVPKWVYFGQGEDVKLTTELAEKV